MSKNTKMLKAVKTSMPLKPRLDFVIRRLELQKQKLDQAKDRFAQRDKAIYARILDALTKHDAPRARVFSNELVEVRKMERIIITAALTIEQIIARLRPLELVGEAVSSVATAVIALRSVRINLTSIFPEAEIELGEIGNALSSVVIEAGQIIATTLDFNAVTLEAQQLIKQAAETTEKMVKEKFPEVPPGGE